MNWKWRNPDDSIGDILTDIVLSIFALAFILAPPTCLVIAIWHGLR